MTINHYRYSVYSYRYTVGNDAAIILQAKRTMSDREFMNLMKKQFLLQ
jgi:hypothetical protein